MSAAGVGPVAAPSDPSKNRWVKTTDLASRTFWHVGRFAIAVEAAQTLPCWVNTTFDVFTKQAWVIRPIVKSVQAYTHWHELKEEWNKEDRSWVQIGLMTDVLAFDALYVATALLMGATMVTGNPIVSQLGEYTMVGVMATLPAIYGGIAINAIERSSDAEEAGEATVRQLHQNTYDLLMLLLMGTCDALTWKLFDCRVKSWLVPLLGTLATTTELFYIWRLPESEEKKS